MPLGVRQPAGRSIEGRESAVRDWMGLVLFVRLLQRLQRRVGIAAGPLEVRERQARGNRLRIGLDRLFESGLGGVPIALGDLHQGQVRVGLTAAGIELNGVVQLRDRAFDIAQAGHGVTEHDLRVDVLRVVGEHGAGAGARVLELARHEHVGRGLELGADVLGHEIRGTGVLAIRAVELAVGGVRLAQLVARFAPERVELNRVQEFEDGFRQLPGLKKGAAALDVSLLGGLVRARSGQDRRRTDEQHEEFCRHVNLAEQQRSRHRSISCSMA